LTEPSRYSIMVLSNGYGLIMYRDLNPNMSRGYFLMFVFVAIVLFMIVSTMDANDAEREERVYCQAVADGIWPHTRNIDCSDM